MTKIEEVARAICVARGINPDDALPEEIREGSGPWPYWQAFTKDARAAIEAMREPTEAMSKAAYEADGTSMMLAIAYEDVWREMIDAALAEGAK